EYERWSYNTAVAAFMEFTNLLYVQGSTPFAIDTLLQLLAPMAPHITAELWARRHDGEHIHERRWPVADAAMAAVDHVTMIVQVNGKVRVKLEVSPDIDAVWLSGATLVVLPLPMRLGSIEEFAAQTRVRMASADVDLLVIDPDLAPFIEPQPADPPTVGLNELFDDVVRLRITSSDFD